MKNFVKKLIHDTRTGKSGLAKFLIKLHDFWKIFVKKLLNVNRFFELDGVKYEYYIGGFWNNERAVENSIIYREVRNAKGRDILEIGNVLMHYYVISHEVVNKYEKAVGVLNVDIVKFKTDKKYDLIVSISTIEHVGFDEKEEYPPGKPLEAISHIKTLLKPGGRLAITLPLKYNPEIDEMVTRHAAIFDKISFIMRTSRSNIWKQVTYEETLKVDFGSPYKGANSMAICYYENKN